MSFVKFKSRDWNGPEKISLRKKKKQNEKEAELGDSRLPHSSLCWYSFPWDIAFRQTQLCRCLTIAAGTPSQVHI